MAVIRCLVENSVVEALFIPDVFPLMIKHSVQSGLKRCSNSHLLLLHQNLITCRCCIPCLISGIVILQLPLVLVLAVVYLQNTLKALFYLRCTCVCRIFLPKLCVMFYFARFNNIFGRKVCNFSPILGVTAIIASHKVHDLRH